MSSSVISSSRKSLKKYEIVNALISKYELKSFLEICTPTTGFTFQNVDTRPLKIVHRYIYNSPDYHDDEQATSFRSGLDTSAAMLRALARPGVPDRPYDCIFVDSLHTYHSTAIDLAGAFALLAEGGALVMHDCNPAHAALADPAFKKGAWCGVSYAAFIDFVLRRGTVTYYTVDCDHGCGVILKRPPTPLSKATEHARTQLAFEWESCRSDDAAQFRFFQHNNAALLNLISPEAFLKQEAASAMPPARAPIAVPALSKTGAVTRWWQSPAIIRHVNRMICGKPLDGAAAGDVERLKALSGGTPFARAVSHGGGNVQHEIRLLQAGVVDEFDLFEPSELRAEAARHRAGNAGVGRRLHIHTTHAIAAPAASRYQLVYWKDSLQRLPDVKTAIAWSHTVLETGGVFFADAYVGHSRRQYTDRQLALAERVRAALPETYLRNPHVPGEMLALCPSRPDAAALRRADPSDCPDTGTILDAVRATFPDARITPTGGIVYLIALSDVLANMDETADEAILRAMLFADELCIEAGETLYAAIDARAG